VDPQVVRYSERPELWDSISGLSEPVWPEYNLHGETLNFYWAQLYDVFPEWQFVLYDPDGQAVLAEGHTIPLAWDGTDPGLGPGIDATLTAAFELRAAGEQPTAASALAAEIPRRHQGRNLSGVLLTAMAGLARGAGLSHLIAPVRPSQKDRYPTIRALRPVDPVGQQQRDDRRVRGDGAAGTLGQFGDPGLPRKALRLTGVDVGQDEIDDQPFQFLAIADVPVQRHGADAELGRHGAHGQSGDAITVEDGEGRGRDRGVG